MPTDKNSSKMTSILYAVNVTFILLILSVDLNKAAELSAAATPTMANDQTDTTNRVQTNEQQQQQQQQTNGPFSLIDWNSYKRMFNKNYSSITQQLMRQKIFMSKMIQVFLVSARWRLNDTAYFTAINQFSDLTPEEERRKLSGDGGDYASDDEDDDMMDDEQAHRVLLHELEDGNSSDSDDESDDEEGDTRRGKGRRRKPSSGRHKRSTDLTDKFAPERKLSIGDLVRVPNSSSGKDTATALDDDTTNEQIKIKWVVPSNNPHYQAVDTISHGADEGGTASNRVDDIPEEDMGIVEQESNSWLALPISKLVNVLGSSAKSTFNWIRSNSFKGVTLSAPILSQQRSSDQTNLSSQPSSESNLKSTQAKIAAANDQLIVDWRKSGCIAPPIDQKDCQSCYAVSSMAFLEWAFCMNQNRVLTPLSVQYLVSCGPQYKQEADPALKIQFYGCDRGRSRQAMYFVKDYGLELAAHMPYLARDSECPIEMRAPLKSKGYIRPNVKQHVRLGANTSQLDLALKVGPVIVNFREPADFLAYGGGMVTRCYQRGGHAMLVVGHGVENNTPYLLIKNSFGTNWGMNGYFKFDRKYTAECIKDFILPRVSFPSKKSQLRRAKAYLADHQKDAKSNNAQQSSFDLDENFDVAAGGLFTIK